MISKNGASPRRYLPHVLAATFLVGVLPLLAVNAIQATGHLQAPVISVALAIVISLAAARVCSAYWTRRPGSSDIVFGDLLIWGWVRRLRTEKRLARATELLALDGRPRRTGEEELDSERQAEVLQELAAALEARDPYTHGHTRRVTRHSHMIAKRMGLPSEQVASIRAAAAVHDVGKISVPREILNKPGRLTDEEFKVMKAHAQEGAVMVSRIGDPEIIAMVRHHHEQLDGSGYPDGLQGPDIPLGARIIAVADTFDAMTSSRPYRSARQHKEAIEALNKSAGSQLDPGAVRAFQSYYSGKRGIAWWGFLTTAPERLLGWLGGAFGGAGAAPVAKGAAMVGATAMLGGSLASPAPPGNQHAGTPVARAGTVVEATGYHADTRLSLGRAGRTESGGRPKSVFKHPGYDPGTGSGPRTDSGSGPQPEVSGPSPDGGSGSDASPGSSSDSGAGLPSTPDPGLGSDPGSGSGSGSGSKPGLGSGSPDLGSVPEPLPELALPDVPDLPLPDLPLSDLLGPSR